MENQTMTGQDEVQTLSAAIPTQEQVDAAVRKMAERIAIRQAARAKAVERRRRDTNHAPGETKSTVAAKASKRHVKNKAAKKSRRTNRRR